MNFFKIKSYEATARNVTESAYLNKIVREHSSPPI